MLRVGLTGSPASGKSAAAACFRALGAAVSQSDEIARAMMQPGEPVYAAIVERFGPGVVRAGGTLDRRVLADLAFQQGRVEELNAIVHPAVIAVQNRWMSDVGVGTPDAVAVVESALLLETRHAGSAETADEPMPWRSRFDRIVVVSAPRELQEQRYLARVLAADPSLSHDAALADLHSRQAVQLPEERKLALADFVLWNEGSLDLLRERVATLYAGLQREAADQTAGAM